VKHYEYKRISIGVRIVGKDLFKYVIKYGGIKSYEEFQKILEIDAFFNDEKYEKQRELSAVIFELMRTARYFESEYHWPQTIKIILVPIAKQNEPLSKLEFTLYYMTSVRQYRNGKREIRHNYTLLMSDKRNNEIDNILFFDPEGYEKTERNGVIILSRKPFLEDE